MKSAIGSLMAIILACERVNEPNLVTWLLTRLAREHGRE